MIRKIKDIYNINIFFDFEARKSRDNFFLLILVRYDSAVRIKIKHQAS